MGSGIYTPERYNQSCGSGICMDPADDGEWIRYYSHLMVKDGMQTQHNADSRELRRLCHERDQYKEAAHLLEANRDDFVASLQRTEAVLIDLYAADVECDNAEAGLSSNGDGPMTERAARYSEAQKRRAEALAAATKFLQSGGWAIGEGLGTNGANARIEPGRCE